MTPFRSLVLFLAASALTAHAGTVDFNYDIRPIISSKCFHCHGPDEAARKAKLRLDIRDEALKEREGTRAIVPGDLKASELVLRIRSHDKDEVMPPPKEGEPLTAHEAELLEKWVQEGAEYKEHWAWSAPKRPAVPAVEGQVRNPIDAFIIQKVRAAGLAPSPEADRATLIRRASLDLIGLPPTPAEVQAFLKDPAPDAYEKAVDRMLASPRFGEKWTRMWLDLARYADSTGYGSDALRLNIWPYRDWLINAFNRNLAYDQFTIEQLAGDLLEKPTQDQLIATAFHRNTMTNIEGGTIDEEWRVAAVKDRIATTAQVWMGLTLQCAQCHTHKFDPIAQRDYYSFYAIFNQTEDNDRADEAPTLPLPNDADAARTKELAGRVADADLKLKQALTKHDSEIERWEIEVRKEKQPDEIAAIFKTLPDERTPAQKKKVIEYHRSESPFIKGLEKEFADRKKEQGAFKPLAVPVMRELAAGKQRETHLLTKGNYLAPAEKVQPALLPAFGEKMAEEKPPTRLDVARWLVTPGNPLTARVAVNRFWSQLFGVGLVETEEDFGTQGALPSHPDLLDWLAVTFESPKNSDAAQLGLGWDMKALLKLIVTSATYRQTSRVLPEHLQKDARNRLLARFPRHRLEAELVRDQALALSGLLSAKVGGPSVYPPQPDGLWRVAFNGGQNAYKTSTGEDRYRRGLYTIWRRTMPYPAMATFDAPSRESCTLRRLPTNTPLQAFVTLNDPCFVECAQSLARRIVKEGGTNAEQRVRWSLRLVTAREPDEAQVSALQRLLEAELSTYKADATAATKLATSPTQTLPAGANATELAAWTVVANVLLNLDAVLTKN